MKCFFLSLIVVIGYLGASAQDGIIGEGFTNGWNTSDIISFNSSLGGSYIGIINPQGTGDRYFRLMQGTGIQWGPFDCQDTDWTGDINNTYFNMGNCTAGGAFFINCPNTTDNYVFKTSGQNENDFIYFRVQGAIRSVTSVSEPLSNEYSSNTPYDVFATLDDPLNPGQGVFLRYSIDNFNTSTVVKMDEFGIAFNNLAADYIATIPGFGVGTTVRYYVFTSGDFSEINDATVSDWFTINANTNGGSNYSYTTQSTVPVKLKNLTGLQYNTSIILEWNVISEISNDFYTIEKNENGLWKNIGMVFSKYGRTSEEKTYQFIDPNPSNGKNVYRLTQTDYDGTATELGIESVQYESIDVSIYPNPFINLINIKLPESQAYQTRIIDMAGRVINNHSFRGDYYQMDLQDLTPGQYHLNILDQGEKLIHSSIISKLR